MHRAADIPSRRLVRQIYRGLDGFDVAEADEEVVHRRRSSPMYGEIMPAATGHLIDYLALRPKDVLFDLGSGVGKLILQTAVTRRIRRCVGIELVAPRHRMSVQALERARADGLLRTRDVTFLRQDFMRADLSAATVVYTCSTAFPDDLMRRLARRLSRLASGTRVVSLQDFDDNPWFEEQEVLRLDMSWRRGSRVYVYRRK